MGISIIQNPVPQALVDAKGDIFVATADNTVGRLPIGANDTLLTADSTQSGGLKWSAPVVTASSTNTFTNKTIALGSNTVTGTIAEFNSAVTDANLATQSALDLKADLASPTFTGTPTLPTGTIAVTQSPGNNTTAVATTAFVTAAIPSIDSGALEIASLFIYS